MMRMGSLRNRILLGLLGYLVTLSVIVSANGFLVNEHIEELVWQTLLDNELDNFQERARIDPGYRWVNTPSMSLYDTSRADAIPRTVRGLPPGLHDGVLIDGREHAVLVGRGASGAIILTLDITELERREADMTLTMAGAALAVALMLATLAAWGATRLVAPLSRLAEQISQLKSERLGQQVSLPAPASDELAVIASALNDYLRRNDQFVEREREFIDMASHELRTPLAVIGGAAELALRDQSLSDAVRMQLARIRQTTRDVEQLVSLLLVLAKDPARLPGFVEPVALADVIAEIVDDHRHLTDGKDLALTFTTSDAEVVAAPLPIVHAAVGNLVRNAIEQSDRGTISVRLEAATVVISDPGHGMSPEEVSALYSRLARGGGERNRGGIGLELIMRLCRHLGWSLSIDSEHGTGTQATLRLRDVAHPPAGTIDTPAGP